MKKLLFLVLASAVFLAACEDPAANKPKATTTNSTTSNSTTANVPANKCAGDRHGTSDYAGKFKSRIYRIESYGQTRGGFKQFSGTIDLVNNKPEDSKVSVEIDMNSLFTDTEDLTKHLKTADFFDVEKYPKSSFVSTKIVADTAKGAE